MRGMVVGEGGHSSGVLLYILLFLVEHLHFFFFFFTNLSCVCVLMW